MKIEISPQKNNIFLSMVEYGRRSMRHHKCGAVLTTKKRNILITPYIHAHTQHPKCVSAKEMSRIFIAKQRMCACSVKTHEIVVSTPRAYY